MRDNLTTKIKTKDNLDTVKVKLKLDKYINKTFKQNAYELYKQIYPNVSYNEFIKEVYN